MEQAFEIDFINSIAGKFTRSPLQRNKIHQSDAEIISLDDSQEKSLAVTMDTVSEEIKFGLYDDPYLIGWMTVMVNMSDLAAVGASPLGILISEAFTAALNQEYILKIQEGIDAACKACGTFVLGGDVSNSDQLALTGCAIGMVEGKNFLSRVGCKPGDLIYSTGKLGRGNGFALQKMNKLKESKVDYKPIARLAEGKSLLEFANCCMDTSDGTISTLDQIMRLNNCGIQLKDDWENIIDEDSKKLCDRLGIPLWLLLAGYHGEFELIFSVNPNIEGEMLNICTKNNWNPLRIGHKIDEPHLVVNLYGSEKKIDTSLIRNLAFQHSGDIKRYVNSLLEYDIELRNQ